MVSVTAALPMPLLNAKLGASVDAGSVGLMVVGSIAMSFAAVLESATMSGSLGVLGSRVSETMTFCGESFPHCRVRP